MNVLSRYVFTELAKAFLVTVSGMTVLMIVVGLVQEAVRESLTPVTILRLIPYVLPNALCFAIPGTALFATCLVLGRMASSNEVEAVKAAGISPMVFVWPAVVLAVALSVITVFLNDLASSWGRKGVYRVVLHSVEKTIYSVLNSQRSYQNGRVSIYVDDVQGKTLIRPVVHVYSESQQGDLQFTADTASLSIDPERDMLVFSVKNATARLSRDGFTAILPDGDVPIPLRDATKRDARSESPSGLALNEIAPQLVSQAAFNKTRRRQLAMQASFQMLGGDIISLTHPRWNNYIADLAIANQRVFRLQTEPWRRWANGFSCLFFVVVGAPLAIMMRKSDFWNTFAVCFIPILLAYYPLMMFGVGRAKHGTMPPPIVWIGNLVLLAIGWYLTRRMLKH
jgi:lipopolysaccharide export system permease protein